MGTGECVATGDNEEVTYGHTGYAIHVVYFLLQHDNDYYGI